MDIFNIDWRARLDGLFDPPKPEEKPPMPLKLAAAIQHYELYIEPSIEEFDDEETGKTKITMSVTKSLMPEMITMIALIDEALMDTESVNPMRSELVGMKSLMAYCLSESAGEWD